MEGHGPLTDPLSSQQQHRRKTGGSIWKRMAAAGALACLLAGVLTGCGGVVPRAKADEDRPTVTVGCDTYSPFSYVDVDGNLTGIDIELASEAFSRMGYEPEFTIINWEEKKDLLFALLGKGYADALAAHDTSVEQFMAESGLEFRILDQPLLTVGLGVAFDKDDTRGLNTKLDEVLKEMKADGTTRAVLSEYMSDPDRYLEGGDES